MRVAINKDSWSPIYFLHTDPAGLEFLPTFEIPDDLFKRCETAKREFAEIQTILGQIYKGR